MYPDTVITPERPAQTPCGAGKETTMNKLHTRWKALVLAFLLALSLAVPAAAAELKAAGSEDLYVVTCFSDRDKILSQVVKEA